MFYDRACVRIASLFEPKTSELDVQFKLCYQFLKHSFGLKYLPPAAPGDRNIVRVTLDTHSSEQHKGNLIAFAGDLPRMLDRDHDMEVQVSFKNSKHSRCLQLCDVMIGAAGWYGNDMFMLREGGRRGMSEKQKLKLAFAKDVVYVELRKLDARFRGSHAFNWHESTGLDGDLKNFFRHPVRIWNFKPARYQIDAGWQNDQLDKYGNYVNQDLQPERQTVPWGEPALEED